MARESARKVRRGPYPENTLPAILAGDGLGALLSSNGIGGLGAAATGQSPATDRPPSTAPEPS